VPKTDTTTTTGAAASSIASEVAAGGPISSSGLAAGAPSSPPQMAAATASVGVDDNAVEEPEVIMGHPGLRAPRDVFLCEAMGTSHFALNQAHNVLHWEREDINKERL
jgi:hypothetical protein